MPALLSKRIWGTTVNGRFTLASGALRTAPPKKGYINFLEYSWKTDKDQLGLAAAQALRLGPYPDLAGLFAESPTAKAAYDRLAKKFEKGILPWFVRFLQDGMLQNAVPIGIAIVCKPHMQSRLMQGLEDLKKIKRLTQLPFRLDNFDNFVPLTQFDNLQQLDLKAKVVVTTCEAEILQQAFNADRVCVTLLQGPSDSPGNFWKAVNEPVLFAKRVRPNSGLLNIKQEDAVKELLECSRREVRPQIERTLHLWSPDQLHRSPRVINAILYGVCPDGVPGADDLQQARIDLAAGRALRECERPRYQYLAVIQDFMCVFDAALAQRNNRRVSRLTNWAFAHGFEPDSRSRSRSPRPAVPLNADEDEDEMEEEEAAWP